MNKNKILPIIGLLLLLGSIAIVLYFKNVERKIIKEDNNVQSNTEEKNFNSETKIDSDKNLNKEMIIETEEIDTLDEDLIDLENLISDPILNDIDSDLSNF